MMLLFSELLRQAELLGKVLLYSVCDSVRRLPDSISLDLTER